MSKPLSEESLREKMRLFIGAGVRAHVAHNSTPNEAAKMLFENELKAIEDMAVSLILQDRQAWGEQERTAGHRMEAYITWEKYAKQKKRNHLIDLHFADYLHRRFNDLTDQLIEQTGNTNYEHYDYNAETGEVVERNTSGRSEQMDDLEKMRSSFDLFKKKRALQEPAENTKMVVVSILLISVAMFTFLG